MLKRFFPSSNSSTNNTQSNKIELSTVNLEDEFFELDRNEIKEMSKEELLTSTYQQTFGCSFPGTKPARKQLLTLENILDNHKKMKNIDALKAFISLPSDKKFEMIKQTFKKYDLAPWDIVQHTSGLVLIYKTYSEYFAKDCETLNKDFNNEITKIFTFKEGDGSIFGGEKNSGFSEVVVDIEKFICSKGIFDVLKVNAKELDEIAKLRKPKSDNLPSKNIYQHNS